MNILKKFATNIIDDIKTTFTDHANVLTIIITLAILFAGARTINDPSSFGTSLLVLSGIIIGFLVLVNAKVFIKAIVSLVITAFTASIAFQSGFIVAPETSISSTWMLATFFVLTASIAISYILKSGQSRWTLATIAVVSSYVTTYIFGLMGLNITLSVILGSLTAITIFVLLYSFGGRTRYSKEHFPKTGSKTAQEKLLEKLEKSGLDIRILDNKKQSSILAWNETHAYVFHTIKMEQQFTNIAKRKNVKLGYKGKNINPWLIDLIHTQIPLWRSRGVTITLVLVDEGNNFPETKVVGVSIPDTNKKIPVGIVSLREKNLSDKVFNETKDFVANTLSIKDKKILSTIGKEK